MKWLDRLLKSIAEANREQYGNAVPRCCQGWTKPGPRIPSKGDR